MAKFKEGFYALYYTGSSGVGNLLICFKGKRLVGIDAAGGKVSGSYEVSAKGIAADIVFEFAPGTLVTGQVLVQPLSLPAHLVLPRSIFSGDTARIDIGMGPVNARAIFVADCI